MSRLPDSVPDALAMGDALGRSDVLRDLQQRLRMSQELLACARSVLPAELVDQIASGVLDEKGWTLLARTSAAAAKLRQCLPRIEASLTQKGRQVSAIRIRVQSRQTG